MFTLDEFKSSIRDIVFSNRFLVSIYSEIIDFSDIWFHVKTVNIPQFNINEIEYKVMGETFYINGFRTYEPINIEFINTNNIYSKMLYFFQSIHDFTNSVYMNYEDYRNTTIYINQLNLKNGIVKTFKFYYCIPINISEIQLSMDETDHIETFTMTFRYAKIEVY